MELSEAAMELPGSYYRDVGSYHKAARSCHGAIIEVGSYLCGCQKLPWSYYKGGELPMGLPEAAMEPIGSCHGAAMELPETAMELS
jgi:hypothetical protein